MPKSRIGSRLASQVAKTRFHIRENDKERLARLNVVTVTKETTNVKE